MRTPLFALATALTLCAGPLEKSDRERIQTELNLSSKQFLDSIDGLSQEQWTFKAGPDRWSIAEVSEHIIAAEGFIGTLVEKQAMSNPADPAKAEQRRAGNSKMDEGLLVRIRDRSAKATAPGEIVPKGIYKTPAEAADAFKAARGKTLEYVATTNEAMRDHFFSLIPGIEFDGVQGMLFLAGHNERHVLQIEEVKQSPNYPKK